MMMNNIALILTERCNFACTHCGGNYGRNGQDMPLAHALKSIELAAKNKVLEVVFSGGEPSLYPGLIPCIEKAALLGLYTCVASNGSFTLKKLVDMKRAGLQEMHISYDKYRTSFITPKRVKRIIDAMVNLDITPVLVIHEANSVAKYEALFGDYCQFWRKTDRHTPIAPAGRAVNLPRAEFIANELIEIGKTHEFGINVHPGGLVSFCPVNLSFGSMMVDLASDWLDIAMKAIFDDAIVQILLNGGVSGLLRWRMGSEIQDWYSHVCQCTLCLIATNGYVQLGI
jgi:hypothetical protein